jgi:3-sulfinopropanoyl-CoA desulfinase
MPFHPTPEQRALKEKARALARGEFAHRAAEIDRSEQYPGENVALLRDAGFLGMTIPRTYNGQRIGAATVALGLAAGAYELALGYAQEREQFGRPIAEFQGLQWMLADMAISIAAAQALIDKAVARPGDGFPDALEAAQAKIFTSEMAVRVTNDALQLFGAAGYSHNRPLERMVRDARMFTIGGGTAQILRTVVASRLLGRKLPQTRDGYLADRH